MTQATRQPADTGDDVIDLPRAWWRRVPRDVLIAGLLVAIGVTVVWWGVMSGVTGDDRNNFPAAVESVIPVPEANQTLHQASIVVDLASGYTGELTIDGVTIETRAIDEIATALPSPGDQVTLPPVTIYEPGNATLTFTPSAGAPIDEWSSGLHQAKVTYWQLIEGRGTARSYTWTFTVV